MTIPMDGTLDSAASMIDQIPMDEMDKGAAPERARADDGKFAKTEAEAPKTDEAAPVEAAKPEAEPEDEDTYIELPPDEDGKEPSRYKLNEVVDGWRKAQTLEAELARTREQGPPPDQWEQQIIETVQTRQKMLDQIEAWARANAPQPPDIGLLDAHNPNYNPDLYFQQYRQHEALKQAHERAYQQHQELAQKQTAEQEALSRVRLDREKAKLERVWPELKEKSVADKVRSDLASAYGLDADTINSVSDARFFALAKDALAYRAQKATATAAAKVVSAKPKLIPGKARSTVNGKAASFQSAMGRLQQSGSVDDAASAIANLI